MKPLLTFFLFLLILAGFVSCKQYDRNCSEYKTGTFTFEYTIDSIVETSLFQRTESLQIETFRGKTDTSTVRWINDCEFVLQKKNPKNREEKKAIHIKILNTTPEGYFFEYSYINESGKQKGFAKNE